MTESIDVENTPVTAHFGLTRIGPSEGFDKNGWAFSDPDRTKIDDVLWALANHKHSGTPALGNPTDEPTFAVMNTGGHLVASTTYYYRCSFLDQWGLETAASPEASIDIPDPVPVPTAPAATVEGAGGTVVPGVYSFVITFLDGHGGETSPSTSNDVQVNSDTINRIRLDLPDLADGATSYSIYRSRPGQSAYYYVASTTNALWYDTGIAEDQTVQAPVINSTNSNNAIEVTVPGGFIPQDCVGWRIYRTDASGDYQGTSLVHEVTEGVTDTDSTPRLTWVDTGDALVQGYPLSMTSTLASPSVLSLGDYDGSFPIDTMPRGAQCVSATAPGSIVNGQTITVTETIVDVHPTRFTAFFKTPPTATVTLHATDSIATAGVDLVCSSATARVGDPAGYYRLGFPVTDAGQFQAENGAYADSVDIITDLAANSGQAANMDTTGEWVRVTLGVLDAGQYTSSASIRVTNIGPSGGPGDLVIDAIRADTSAVLASVNYPSGTQSSEYTDWVGPTFTAPGAVAIQLRVSKATTSTQAYAVDSMTATPVIPKLAKGLIKITATVTGTASDANIVLWF